MRVAVLPLLSLAACFHTTLNPPPVASAPLPERVLAYQQLRKAGEQTTITITGSGASTVVDIEHELVLANGETVRHADDLLPVVDENSAAARSARRSASARDKKWGWMLAGSAVATASMFFAIRGMNDDPESDDAAAANESRFKLGLGVAVVGALAGTIGGLYYQHVENSQRAAAFANYDDGLRARMSLCVNGMQITDCNAPPPVSLRMSASPR